MLITFLLYTLAFWAGTAAFIMIAFFLIQEGQLLGGWQHVLSRLRNSRSAFKRELAKPLGDCEMCFAHALAAISFCAYLFFAKEVVGFWISDLVTTAFFKVVTTMIWYMIYVPVATILSLLTITKIFRQK